MNKLAIAALAFVALAFTGCNPPPVEIHSTYNPEEIAYMKVPGNNTIKVNAFLLQRDGGNVTCAGKQVALIGVSTYATERMTALYGSVANPRVAEAANFQGDRFSKTANLPNPDTRYIEDTVRKTCNSGGWATFENVADGDYYLATDVRWQTSAGYYENLLGTTWSGGGFMRKVSVSGGETIEVIMSH